MVQCCTSSDKSGKVSTRNSKNTTQRCLLGFFLWDEEFVSKAINDSNIDLNTLPASKARQLAKKMESSKSTAKHIKQVTNELHATQVHLKRCQHTELPPNKFQRKQRKFQNSRQATNMHYWEEKQREKMPQVQRRNYNNYQAAAVYEKYSHEDRCNKCGDCSCIEGFRCPASRYQCKNCHKFGHFRSLCYKKQESYKKRPRSPKAYQLTSGC